MLVTGFVVRRGDLNSVEDVRESLIKENLLELFRIIVRPDNSTPDQPSQHGIPISCFYQKTERLRKLQDTPINKLISIPPST